MESTETNVIRDRLVQMRIDLREAAESSRDDVRPVVLDQSSVGRLSRMDAMQVQEMAQETARRRTALLARIEGALRRIGAGEFGLCFVCGDEIDPRRLAADPTSTRCIGCQEKSG